MAKWIKCILGEFVVFQRGYDLPKSQMQEGEYPVVGSNGIIGFHNDYTTDEPSITIGRSGNVGKPFIHYGKTWSHNTTLYIKDYKGNDPVFAFYYLKTLDLANYAGGSAVPTLNRNHIHTLPIYVLNSTEQQKHVGLFFKRLDEKIETNKKINDNLEQQTKLLYDYWFSQFDFPNEKGEPYRTSGGKMVWNETLKRYIPNGWNVVPFLEIASWESNSQPPKSEFVYEPKDGYIRFIQNRDYDSDTHKTYIPITKNLSIVDRYDILMDKYGDAGAVRYGIEGAFNVALGKISVHNPNQREYVRSFLESDGIYNYLHNSCMASTRASLSEANLSMLNIVIPSKQIVSDYEYLVKKIRDTILQNNDETARLIELREWLLPMLMNGQASIKD